uniref:Uncharacterized protein n=1 Tax=Picea sitchensis TaxID=3332 RepID=B8LPS3_PICSI|nr:unknown [Picea sitchensis]
MLEAASFSLRALLVFRHRVRGGDGIELSSGSEVSTESLEGIETVRPAEVEGSGSEARNSLATTGPGGVESGRLSSTGGSSFTAVASRSRASSSFSASKLFLFSRVASVE